MKFVVLTELDDVNGDMAERTVVVNAHAVVSIMRVNPEDSLVSKNIGHTAISFSPDIVM